MTRAMDLWAYKNAVPYIKIEGTSYTDVFGISWSPQVSTKGGPSGFSVRNKFGSTRTFWEGMLGKIAYIMVDLNEDSLTGAVVSWSKVNGTVTVNVTSTIEHQFMGMQLELTSGTLDGAIYNILDSTISGSNTILTIEYDDEDAIDLDDLVADDTININFTDQILHGGVITSLANDDPLQIVMTGQMDLLDRDALPRDASSTILFTGKVYEDPSDYILKIVDDDGLPIPLTDVYEGCYMIVEDNTEDNKTVAYGNRVWLIAPKDQLDHYGALDDETWSCHYDALESDHSALWTRQTGKPAGANADTETEGWAFRTDPYGWLTNPLTQSGFGFGTWSKHEGLVVPNYYDNNFPKWYGYIEFQIESDHTGKTPSWNSRISKDATINKVTVEIDAKCAIGNFNGENKSDLAAPPFLYEIYWIADIADIGEAPEDGGPIFLTSRVMHQNKLRYKNKFIRIDATGDNAFVIPADRAFVTGVTYKEGGHLLFTIRPVNINLNWDSQISYNHWLVDYVKVNIEYSTANSPEENLMIYTVEEETDYTEVQCFENATGYKEGTGLKDWSENSISNKDGITICYPAVRVFSNAFIHAGKADLGYDINNGDWIDLGIALDNSGITGYGLLESALEVKNLLTYIDYNLNRPTVRVIDEEDIDEAIITISRSNFPINPNSFNKTISDTAIGYTKCYYKYGETDPIPADGTHNGLTTVCPLHKSDIVTMKEAIEAAREYSNKHKTSTYQYSIGFPYLPKFIPRVGQKYNIQNMEYDSDTDQYVDTTIDEDLLCRQITGKYSNGLWSFQISLGTESTPSKAKVGMRIGHNTRLIKNLESKLASSFRHGNKTYAVKLSSSGIITDSHIKEVIFEATSPYFTNNLWLGGSGTLGGIDTITSDVDVDLEIKSAGDLLSFYLDTTTLALQAKSGTTEWDYQDWNITGVKSIFFEDTVDIRASGAGMGIEIWSFDDIDIKSDGTTVLLWDESDDQWEFKKPVIFEDSISMTTIQPPAGSDLTLKASDATHDVKIVTSADASVFAYDGGTDVLNVNKNITFFTGITLTIGGNAIDDIQLSSDAFSDVDDELMTAAAINDRIEEFIGVEADSNEMNHDRYTNTEAQAVFESLTLKDIGDVNATSPADEDVLTWDSSADEWIATSRWSTGSGGITELDTYPLCHTSTSRGTKKFTVLGYHSLGAKSPYDVMKAPYTNCTHALSNLGSVDGNMFLSVDLPTTIEVNGVTYKLWISKIGFYCYDMDTGDYVNYIWIYGGTFGVWAMSSTGALYSGGTGHGTGHKSSDFSATPKDCSSYDFLIAIMYLVVTHAADLDMTVPYYEFYYEEA